MANKLAKEFSESNNHDFGSFTPKNAGNQDEYNGAKGDVDKSNNASKNSNGPNNGKNANSHNGSSNTQSKNATSESAKSGGAKQQLNDLNVANKAKQNAKADLKASVTGGDRNQILQEEKDKDNDPKNKVAKAAKGKAARKAAAKVGKSATSKSALGKVGAGIGGKATGGLGAVKALGSGMVGALKGGAAALAAGVTKAGAVVAGFLNVSATVGTAIVLSGAVAAATIPTAGVIGYGVSHHVQRTDGCTPEEYDSPSASGGELIAVTAERLAWPEGTAVSKYDYDMGGTPTDAAAAAADQWYPSLKNGSWNGRSGRYWQMACCCHSANVIVREACQTDKIGNLLPNTNSPSEAQKSLESALEGQGFTVFPYDGKESSLKRGDVLSYNKKSGGGHVWIYLGDGKSADGGRGSNVFSHISHSHNRDANLSNYHYYFVMRKQGGSNVSVTSNQGRTATNTTVTARKNIQATIDWARMIANDDSYHYGKGHGGYFTCDYCHHPNASYKAYTCMPFVAAAYAHGTKDPVLFHNGKHRMYLTDQNYTGEFAKVWHRVGWCKDLNFSDLQPGDVVIRWADDNAHGHAWLYGGGDIVLESTHGYGPRETTGAEKKFNSYKNGAGVEGSKNYVMRYIGDGSPLFGSGAYNDLVADMTADDGCGGEMDGGEYADAYVGRGMKKVTAANGEEYIILDFDLEAVKKLGHQGPSQCFIYSIGYCDLILGGKFRCSIEGSDNTKYTNMRKAYGSGNGEDGDIGRINGTANHASSSQGCVDMAVKEIKEGRPVIFWVNNSGAGGSGTHFVCVCGWTAKAGTKITWDDLVCCDPAYVGSWGAGGNGDGLRTMKGYPDHGSHYVATFENWKPGSGQQPRAH